jgi:predicted lipoprotein with Yx(FWY)xxD motif
VNLNGLLATPDHLTLYTYDGDVVNAGRSACNGACMNQWMPFKARADDGPVDGYTIVLREDGRRQWAWKGHPLYTFARDVSGGDITGNNYLGVWHLVRVGESAMLFN